MNVVVIGSLNMDIVIPVHPYPNPGETVLGGSVQQVAGGKGLNQAIAAARMGASVTMVGMVGTDDFGNRLLEVLNAEGIRTETVSRHAGQSGVAFVHVEPDGSNRIIVTPGANEEFTVDVLKRHRDLIEKADAVLVQLEIPLETAVWALQVAAEAGVPSFLDPSPVVPHLMDLIPQIDWITPNACEAEALTGLSLTDAKTAHIAAAKLQGMGARRVLLKMGSKGAYLIDENSMVYQPEFNVEAVDTTAAGDAFVGAFVAEYLKHHQSASALRVACAAGALATTRLGAHSSLPTRNDVTIFLPD